MDGILQEIYDRYAKFLRLDDANNNAGNMERAKTAKENLQLSQALDPPTKRVADMVRFDDPWRWLLN